MNMENNRGEWSTFDHIWDETLATINEKLDRMERDGKCPFCSSPVELDRTKDNLKPYWRCRNTSPEGCPHATEFQQAERNILGLEELLCGSILERR